MSFSLNVLINNKLLNISTDNFELKDLCLSPHILKFSENIYEISITKDYVIVSTEYAVQGKILPNNINAYDLEGNHLWNVADVVGEIGVPFYGGTVTTKEMIGEYSDFDKSKYSASSELFCCSANNHLYIVDLNSRKLVQVLESRQILNF